MSILKKARNMVDSYCRRHNYKPRFLLKLFVTFVILVFVLSFSDNVIALIKNSTTSFGLKDIGELATQAGYYTNVKKIEDSQKMFGWDIPLTGSHYIFSYDGVIKAGLCFDEIEVDVDHFGKLITVTLPETLILSNEIDNDSLKIFDESKSIFTPLSINDVNEAVGEMKADAEETAIANGIFDSARENAKLLIKGFLGGYFDMTEYNIVFK